MDHILHWRQQPGALDFVKSKGADAYKRAMDPASLPPRSFNETDEESRRRREAAERVNLGVKRCDWCGSRLLSPCSTLPLSPSLHPLIAHPLSLSPSLPLSLSASLPLSLFPSLPLSLPLSAWCINVRV